MAERLKNQVAIITGASRGIGFAIAQAFAAEDIAVALVARSEAAIRTASETIQRMGGRAIALPADVTDARAVDSVVDETVRRLGPVDLLINNAGSANALGPIWEVAAETWWQDVSTNLLGTFLCSRAVLPRMIARQHGRIINIVSAFGIQTRPESATSPYASAYSSSKAAVMILTQSLAAMTQAHGVRVFGLRPGFVRTALLEDGAQSPAGKQWLPEIQAILDSGRVVPAELAARWVTFLASGTVDDLSGRVFSVAYDMETVVARGDEIRREGQYALRLIE
jgi:NAD(P)-dependent dehydrogenase (short-subunit alcohol dehydrogenase family)